MKHILHTRWAKAAALLAGFAGAFSAVRHVIPPYDYYVRRQIWIAGLKMDPMLSLFLFAAAAALLCYAVWHSGGQAAPRWWRELDYALLAAAVLLVLLFCVFSALYWHNAVLILLSALSYAAVMTLLMETLARLRDERLVKSLLWARFLRQYPVRHLPGFFMAAMLTGSILYVVVNTLSLSWQIVAYFAFVSREPMSLQTHAVELLYAALTLAGLTYLCSFILSLSARFERANEEKIRAERFKAELIANVSHDIRTPLTSIVNYVDLLKALPVERTDFKTYVDVLDRKSARLKTLTGDLMEASKASTGNLPVVLRALDLGEIIGQIAGEFDDLFTERGLTLVTRLPEDPVIVQADSGHLWRVLENLFGNAAKYALPGTRVFAEITRREGIFSLKNTSQAPIDPDTGALTEQFIRGDRARHTEGSGLGLYIAKSLMELMGGALEIRVMGDLFEARISLAMQPGEEAPAYS